MTDHVKNPDAVALGRLGGKKGGLARAAALTKEQKRAIGIAGARARWKNKPSEPQPRDFVVGTRKVIYRDGAYRVVCATCEGGGTRAYDTKREANGAAIRYSANPCMCRGCGAR